MTTEHILIADGINPSLYPVVVVRTTVDGRIEERVMGMQETQDYLASLLTAPGGTVFNVADYGATGDGVTDDTVALEAAIAAAVAAGGGTVYVPPGIYVLSSTQAATAHVTIQGAGIGNVSAGTPTPTTTILWAGGASPMFTSNAWTNSWSFSDIMLDGDDTATYVVHARSMVDQTWGPTVLANGTVATFFLEGNVAGGNSLLNVFDHLVLSAHGTANCLRIDGDGTTNVCHNRFGAIYTSKTGTGSAVYWGDSDNNVVLNTFLYHDQVTYPAIISWEFRGAARANYIWHMQGANLTARTGSRNSLGWWDRENGQPEPTLEGTAVLNYENDLYGKHAQGLSIHHGDGTISQFNVAGVYDNNIRGVKTTVYSDFYALTNLYVAGKTNAGTNGFRITYAGGGAYLDHKGSDQIHIRSDNVDGSTQLLGISAAGAIFVPTVFAPGLALTDGVAAPSTIAGKAQIYVDTADGDLKIKYGDGTIKTIVVDT